MAVCEGLQRNPKTKALTPRRRCWRTWASRPIAAAGSTTLPARWRPSAPSVWPLWHKAEPDDWQLGWCIATLRAWGLGEATLETSATIVRAAVPWRTTPATDWKVVKDIVDAARCEELLSLEGERAVAFDEAQERAGLILFQLPEGRAE